jgi:hypothetical protein
MCITTRSRTVVVSFLRSVVCHTQRKNSRRLNAAEAIESSEKGSGSARIRVEVADGGLSQVERHRNMQLTNECSYLFGDVGLIFLYAATLGWRKQRL